MADIKKDHTLIAKLGFQDNDLKTKDHDSIFISLINKKMLYKILFKIYSLKFPNVSVSEIWNWIIPVSFNVKPEYPIQSQTGFVVGFLDVFVGMHKENNSQEALCIEIKTKIESVGALIRQINLYRTYMKFGHFIIVAPKIDADQRWALSISNIIPIEIGDIEALATPNILCKSCGSVSGLGDCCPNCIDRKYQGVLPE